jgi:hypothetical protein
MNDGGDVGERNVVETVDGWCLVWTERRGCLLGFHARRKDGGRRRRPDVHGK